ncbi:hypothetical protein C4F51_11460 [Cellvibrio sp. KB43]|uniref:Uncharacterized protein n=1 Tax=Cellvibrio polysaccharolyticus TaxID=2082724 RepID=A0A928V6I2_9GAMM|nr:hypothetical protein [Cellvibrio polysaccharolyticus]
MQIVFNFFELLKQDQQLKKQQSHNHKHLEEENGFDNKEKKITIKRRHSLQRNKAKTFRMP